MPRDMGRVAATIEARMTSTRLPGKVLMTAHGRPMLELMVERVRRAPSIETVLVCTTVNATDDPVEEVCARLNIGCWRGSEEDVLVRVLDGATAHAIDTIVELTGDCPLIDPVLIEDVIALYRQSGADYCSNVLERSFPIGMDTQVFSTRVLADVARRTSDPIDHEHVSLYIYRHPEIYSLAGIRAPDALFDPNLRLTLDTPEDFALIDAVFSRLYNDNPTFGLPQILALLAAEPSLRSLNGHIAQKKV